MKGVQKLIDPSHFLLEFDLSFFCPRGGGGGLGTAISRAVGGEEARWGVDGVGSDSLSFNR